MPRIKDQKNYLFEEQKAFWNVFSFLNWIYSAVLRTSGTAISIEYKVSFRKNIGSTNPTEYAILRSVLIILLKFWLWKNKSLEEIRYEILVHRNMNRHIALGNNIEKVLSKKRVTKGLFLLLGTHNFWWQYNRVVHNAPLIFKLEDWNTRFPNKTKKGFNMYVH